MTDLEKAKQALREHYKAKDAEKFDLWRFEIKVPEMAQLMAAYASHSNSELEKERDQALADADFWERELNNFRRNAEYRARQMAADVLRGDVEQLVKPWREAVERYASMTPPPPIILNPQLQAQNSELLERVQKLESSLIFANELLALYNMAVCDKHPVSWKLDFAKSCPECAAPETRDV